MVRRVDRSKDFLAELLARFDPTLHDGEVTPLTPYGREIF